MKISIVWFVLILSACSEHINVFTDHDPDFDVQLLSNYKWLEVKQIESNTNPLYYNELNDKRIKGAVNNQLNIHGYSLQSTDPEMIVHYHIVIEDKSVVNTDDYGYRYGPFWMKERRNLYLHQEGTLIIDIMYSKTNELIWRGWAVSVLHYEKPANVEKHIKESVEKILNKFPHSFKWIKPGKDKQ